MVIDIITAPKAAHSVNDSVGLNNLNIHVLFLISGMKADFDDLSLCNS